MDTKQQIIAATTYIFKTRGLAKTTTKEIAREAGCSEGTLYNYFEHKEDLFLAVLDSNLAELDGLIYLEQPGNQTVAANLSYLVQAAIHFCDQLVPMSAALFADPALLAHYRQILKTQERGPQYSYKFFEPYLRAEQELGRISPEVDLVATGALLYGACFQYVFSRHFLDEDPYKMSEQAFVNNLVATLVGGILPKA